MTTGRLKGVRKIARALGCSKTYVRQVLIGERENNTELSRQIKKAYKKLPKAEKNLNRELQLA